MARGHRGGVRTPRQYFFFMLILSIVQLVPAAHGKTYGTKEEKIANQPPALKTSCKNFLGRPLQSLCETDAAYNLCLAYLKEGNWDYCVRSGSPEKVAKRGTAPQAHEELTKLHCTSFVKIGKVSAYSYSCPDTDFLLSTAHITCLAYQNGGSGIACLPPPDLLTTMADKIDANLQGFPVGYAYVIRNKAGKSVARAWGLARKPPDTPAPVPMDVNTHFSIASVSKNITAAALLRLMHEKGVNSKTARLVDYVPKEWVVPPSAKGAVLGTVTLYSMLKHRSGFRCNNMKVEVTYDNLKVCFERSIALLDQGSDCNGQKLTTEDSIGCYDNFNYAFMRVVIPIMKGYTLPKSLDASSGYAKQYMAYVQENVFNRMDKHASPLSSGAIVGYMSTNKELGHDASDTGRSVA